jgi:hypothetical protein
MANGNLNVGPFVTFLGKLQNDPGLQASFKANPAAVGGQNGITAEQTKALTSGDSTQIDAASTAELTARNPGKKVTPEDPIFVRGGNLAKALQPPVI